MGTSACVIDRPVFVRTGRWQSMAFSCSEPRNGNELTSHKKDRAKNLMDLCSVDHLEKRHVN